MKPDIKTNAGGAYWAGMAALADEDEWIKAQNAREEAYARKAGRSEDESDNAKGRPGEMRPFNRAAIPWVHFPAALAASKEAGLGVRGAALVWHIVSSITRAAKHSGKSKLSRYGMERAAVWDTVENFGKAVGLGERQTRRLLQKAVEQGFISIVRKTNHVRIQLKDRNLLFTPEERRDQLRFFHRDLAEKIGLNESILFLLIQRIGRKGYPIVLGLDETGKNRTLTFLPWLTHGALQHALWNLEHDGWVRWEKHHAHSSARMYYAVRQWKVPSNPVRFLRTSGKNDPSP